MVKGRYCSDVAIATEHSNVKATSTSTYCKCHLSHNRWHVRATGCTWAIDADAKGLVLMEEKTSVTRWPRSCSMMGRNTPGLETIQGKITVINDISIAASK